MSSSDSEAEQLRDALAGQCVEVHQRAELSVALMLTGLIRPDLVILGDARGPLDAVQFVQAVRAEDQSLPVLVGISDAGVNGIELGALAAGATALVRRPFSSAGLLQIVRAIDAATEDVPQRPSPIVLKRLRIDGAAPRIWVDGAEMTVPPTEFLLLRHLADRVGDVLTRQELTSAVWGDVPVPSNTLNVHLARLRRRLAHGSTEDWIRPIRGVGYQLVVPQGVTKAAAG